MSNNNLALGKKKQLTQKELKPLRMILQRCKIANSKNNYFYNIITKESGTGFFSNQRMLILNINQRSLMYQSKIPQGYIPFQTEDQILANKEKQKIIIPQVISSFKCVQVKGKISTLSVQWEKDSKKISWILIFGNSKLMNDWIQLLSSMVSNNFNEEMYKNLESNNKQIISNSSPLNQQPVSTQLKKQENKKPQFQNGNINQYNPYKQNNNSVLNPSTVQKGENIQTKPLPNVDNEGQNYGSTHKKPQINKINNNNGLASNGVVHMNPNFSQSSLKGQNLPNQPQQAGNFTKQSNINANPIANTNINTNIATNKNTAANTNNATSNQINPKTNQNQTGLNQNSNQSSLSGKIDKPISGVSNVNANIPNASNVSNVSNTSNNNRPGDFVSELKQLKKDHPSKFQLSNDLSKPKLDPYQQPSYNQNNNSNSYSPDHQRHLNQINSQKKSPESLYHPQPYQSSEHQPKNLGRIKSTKDVNFIINNQESRGVLEQVSQDLQYHQQRRGINNNNRSDMDNFYDDNQQRTHEFNPNQSNNFQRMKSQLPLNQQYNKPETNYPKTNKNTDNQIYDYENRGNEQVFRPISTSMKKQQRPRQEFDNNQIISRQNSRDYLNINRASKSNFNKYSQDLSPHWNQIWLQSSNNTKKIQIHEQFIQTCKKISTQIIDELPFQRKDRHYMPVDIKSPYYTYKVQNIIFTLHYFQNAESLLKNFNSNTNNQSPLLYDQSYYDELKREFYNYNLILSVTKNQGLIRVPLCCYFQYKGILASCKADVPGLYQQIDAFGYKEKFQTLEKIIKVKFLFGTFNIFQGSSNSAKNNKFLLLWNLKNLIPGIPNSMNQNYYFRKQFLLQYDQILEDLETSSEAHAFTLKHIVPELLAKFQSLQTWTISSSDLLREFHKVGASMSYLPQLFVQTNCVYLKKLFMTQIVADVFTSILRSQLNHAFTVLPLQSFQNVSKQLINNILVDCCHVLIQQLLSYSLRAQGIWKTIVLQSSKRYQIIVSKQDIIAGYLLSSIVQRNNLITNFKTSEFDRTRHFFVKENNIPKQCIIDFDIKIRRYDMENICQTYAKSMEILEELPSTQNYEYLVSLLNLRGGYQLPAYFIKIQQELLGYLCNFIPYDQQEEYPHLRLYDSIYYQPHTYYSMKVSILAIKWLIKKRQLQKALQIFQIKCFQNNFWLGEFNPPITQFYDFFSMYYASVGNFQDSIKLAKSSLVNTIRILGVNGLPVADKHYQLGNIYFKIGKKQDCLKQYTKTKQILVSHQQTSIPQYGIILLKLSLLYLNFGKISQCVGNALDALKVFDNDGGNQLEQIQTFQILARAYQITRKTSDMLSVGNICSNKFNHTENPKVLQKMLKIVLFPKLNQLSTQQQKALTQLLIKLKEQFSNSSSEAFAYLHKKSSHCNLTKKLFQFIDNIVQLNDDVNRRDLLRKHKSLQIESNRVQAQQMLGLLQGVGSFIGHDFMLGAIKDSYYQ